VAQELSIKIFHEATNDLSARAKPRQDNNGADCALVKVQIAAPGVTFAGNKNCFYCGWPYRLMSALGNQTKSAENPCLRMRYLV